MGYLLGFLIERKAKKRKRGLERGDLYIKY